MKYMSKAIIKTRLPDQISKQILDMIRTGKLKIGDRLPPEPMLEKQFGVGRGSIREAIGALSMTGVLNVKQGIGTFVTSYPKNRFEIPFNWDMVKSFKKSKELIEARIALESEICQLAVEKATNKDLIKLRNIIIELEKVKNNRKKFAKADQAFHLALARACHNNILMHFSRGTDVTNT